MPSAAEGFVHRIRVNWGDCDPARIVYTARIPAFALDAIDAWWEHQVGADWYRLNIDSNIGTPFVHLDVDFRAPVTPRAALDCEVVLARLGSKSTSFRIRGRQAGVLCFEGMFITAFVVADSFEPMQVPAEIRTRIQHLVQP